MDVLVIEGGHKLSGEVQVSGAKNATLPLMCASLLTAEPLVLENVPQLADVATLREVLAGLGVAQSSADHTLTLQAAQLTGHCAPYELVSKMRAAVLVLGPLLARHGKAVVSLPGGCAIGARPIDVLLDGLRALGATIELVDGYIHAAAPNGLTGAEITFPKPAVTGTENLLMAAVLAKGTTHIHNAAREPEVVDLAACLNQMGARIRGAGTSTIVIEGVAALRGTSYRVMPDRIEAGTYILAAAMAGQGVMVKHALPMHNQALLGLLKASGVVLEEGADWVNVLPRLGTYQAVDVQTAPYPGFATDLQAQMMAYLTQAEGASTLTETVYENRFMHVPELKRMGAQLSIAEHQVLCAGGDKLKGAPVMATDLRASASLVLAALVAEGRTVLRRLYHLDRGYENLVEKLQALGAHVERLDEQELNTTAKLKVIQSHA